MAVARKEAASGWSKDWAAGMKQPVVGLLDSGEIVPEVADQPAQSAMVFASGLHRAEEEMGLPVAG